MTSRRPDLPAQRFGTRLPRALALAIARAVTLPRVLPHALPGAVVLALPAPSGAAPAAEQHAHVHGVVRLDVAVDAGTLTVLLDAPLDSVLGFEHAPRTAAERKAADALRAQLRRADTVVRPPAAAGCTAGTPQVTSEALDAPANAGKPSAPADDPGHKHKHKHNHNHRNKGKDQHAHAHDEQDDEDAAHDDGHADLAATLTFTCAHPDRLDALDVRLFATFARIRRIDVQVAGATGQSRQTLQRPASTLRLR